MVVADNSNQKSTTVIGRSSQAKNRINGDTSGVPSNSDVATSFVAISPRINEFSKKTWWMVDMDNQSVSSNRQGATPLVARCQREYLWDETKCRKVLNAYQQFLELKKYFQDWDATILSPSQVVDQMWHQHLLDVTNYCHDTILLCGHVVGHNPDGALDGPAKDARTKTTRDALEQFFDSDYDKEMWLTPAELREEEHIDCVKKELGLETKEVHSMNSETDSNFGTPIVLVVIVAENIQKQYIEFGSRQTMNKVLSWYSTNVYDGQGSPQDVTFHRSFYHTFQSIDHSMNAEELKLKYGEEIKVVNDNIPITIRLRDQVGEFIYFRLRNRFATFSQLFRTYAKMTGVEVHQLRFLLDGERFAESQTPLDLDIYENDMIDVMLGEGGC